MQTVGLLLLLQGTASWAFYLPGTVFTVFMYDKFMQVLKLVPGSVRSPMVLPVVDYSNFFTFGLFSRSIGSYIVASDIL